MGFSLKKIVQAVAAPIVAPIVSTAKIVDKAGLTDTVNSAGIDLNNLSTVAQQSAKLEGSTGSDSFKNAVFDSAKIGLAAAGGAGVIAGSTAAGGVLLTTKAQMGGGVNLADLGTLAGVPTSFGGLDLGGVDILKPKTKATIEEVWPDVFDEYLPPAIADSTGTKLVIMILGVMALIGAVIFIIRKRK